MLNVIVVESVSDVGWYVLLIHVKCKLNYLYCFLIIGSSRTRA